MTAQPERGPVGFYVEVSGSDARFVGLEVVNLPLNKVLCLFCLGRRTGGVGLVETDGRAGVVEYVDCEGGRRPCREVVGWVWGSTCGRCKIFAWR